MTWLSAGNLGAVVTTEDSILTIPQLTSAPNLDGTVDTREWTEAALLPPIGRLPDGASDGHDTQIFIGWLGENLLIAIKSSRSLQVSAGTTNVEDHLELTLTAAGEQKRTIKVGPGQNRFSHGKSGEGWICKTQSDESGWQAEVQMPLAAIGPKNSWKLRAVLSEPSIGRMSPTLTQNLSFADRHIACRLTEAGEFSNGKYQGAEMEIINADAVETKANVTLILKSGEKEIGRNEQKEWDLPANSNSRLRVTTPWKAGEYSVDYSVQIGDGMLAQGTFRFEASGPIRVSLVPFFLWRQGVFVRTEILNAKPAEVNYKLLDATGRKTLFETTARTGADGNGEGFLSTRKAKPGPYLIRVEASQEGEKLAAFTTTACK